MKMLKAGLAQHACTADREANIGKSIESIRTARRRGAELVVLSELHATTYFCQTEDPARFDLAEAIPGPTTDCFAALARELGIVLVGSFFERRAPGLYHNTAVVFEKDGAIAGKYRKMHIPDDPGYYEKFYFAPGDLGFRPIPTSAGKLGVLVCWDQWYPEAARLMTLRGADLLIYPTAIGWDPREAEEEKQRQLDAWVTIQRGHAIANGLPVLSVNRVGFEPAPGGAGPGIQFWGHSFAAGCQGELLAEARQTGEDVLVVDIDPRRSETVRRAWPFLRDRRIDAYDGLLNRFGDQPRRQEVL
jgi:N-carbamoylputrescine amidase